MKIKKEVWLKSLLVYERYFLKSWVLRLEFKASNVDTQGEKRVENPK